MKRLSVVLLAALFANAAWAFELSSPDVKQGHRMDRAQEYQGFGCNGGNLSPALSWHGAPAGTKSFALTVYDPDAPTGSGWWHWVVYDIPASVHALPGGIGVHAQLPAGVKEGRNDYGAHAFGGTCPPAGDKPHHYHFTVFALDADKLDIPASATAAYVGFNLHAHTLAKAEIVAVYGR